ncbi:MAG: hypothetical protein KF906_11750 [Actinobacteria bacterium]|nr:hypothetical protein [Actinomycetota bacterium]
MTMDAEGAPLYLFVHLQKTAGTALFKRMRHHFGTEHVYPRPEEQGTAEAVLDVELLLERLAADPSGYRAVTGHFPLAVASFLPPGTRTFTLLRDPVERTLSFLRHQREVDPRFEGWDLEEMYEHWATTSGDLLLNHQVKMLSIRPEEMTAGALSPVVVDDARVATAKEALTDRIDVWGIQERFDDFCAELATTFGWDLGDPLFMNRTRPAPSTDALRERILADNGPDVELYRFAVEQLDPSLPGDGTG